MKIIDISWPISEAMTEYKDGKSVKLTPTKTMEHNGVREWLLQMNNHTGTHIDGPAHFLATGQTIDKFELQSVIGPCRVLDLTSVTEKIMPEDLEPFGIEKNEIILLKTTNSFRQPTDNFTYNFAYISDAAAHYLAHARIKALGFDYLGIERNQPNHDTHKAFMQFNIPIVEGLRLGAVSAGSYFFVCLPLYAVGLDSAPARAVLLEGVKVT
ncbi:MAG: cyclase family protein [Candidatus Babeliales bacterium]